MNNDRYVAIVDSYICQVSSVVHSLFPWVAVVKVDILYCSATVSVNAF